MPKRPIKDHDFATVARRVVEQAIGEQLDGRPLEDQTAGKDQKAVETGRLGGQKGGHARAQVLSSEERTRIAKTAARARWKPKS